MTCLGNGKIKCNLCGKEFVLSDIEKENVIEFEPRYKAIIYHLCQEHVTEEIVNRFAELNKLYAKLKDAREAYDGCYAATEMLIRDIIEKKNV